MSEEGERSCPLCAEEMDLTDQQLKPCKCGYEICVWCWHHIMDMAEKDNTEGRCPACRIPYNKEKIVGTASKCEGLVNGMSVEKRQKSQKGKTKTLEGRNQLGNVRVIQRNLVYIVGLPLDLADEDLLQQKEYFGRYGKVLKVSISRTAAGAIQQFANNTCSVYITYSKEEEAIRSIKSTHGFVLEGRPLRACFGTTKYCHAWLRNTPCTNADCLYLHEFGRQEDSFTKDEIVSEYTRNRVQQITGVTNDMQRRSGNLLPPPADEYSNNNTSAWPKPVSKSTANNLAKSLKVSPPNSSSQRSVALPAAASWGTRASNSQPVLANVASSNGPSKGQADLSSSTLSFSAAAVSPPVDELVSKHSEENHTSQEKGNLGNLVPTKKVMGLDHKGTLSETPVNTGLPSCSTSSCQVSTTSLKNKNTSKHSSNLVQDKDLNVADIGRIDNSFSNMSLISTDKNKRLQASEAEEFAKPLDSNEAEEFAKPLDSNEAENTTKQFDLVSDFQNKVAKIVISEVEEDLLSSNDQRLSDKEIVTRTSLIQSLPHISPRPNISTGYSHQHACVSANGNLNPPSVGQNLDKAPQHAFNVPVVNSHSSLDVSNGHSYFHGTEGGRSHLGMFEEAAAAEKGDHSTGLDIGENSIISNILSMDFDPWDESLTSPQNLAKFLGESNEQAESHRVLSSRKAQNSNQSRFSFARQDECTYQGSNYEPNASDFGQGSEYKNFSPDFVSNNSNYLDNKLSNGNGFPSFSSEESNRLAKNFSHMSENKPSVQTVSRTQVSAPPGFSGMSRAPPPGFSSHERMEQTYDHASGNYTFDNSSLLRKAHQATVPVNFGGAGDLELMDPAILAVSGRVPSGLEMRSNFPAQPNSFENDVRLQLLMQTPFSQQNHRFTQLGDNYPHQTDPYGISSRMGENNHLSSYQQNSFQQPRSSLNVNGHWNSWNEAQGGNGIGMAELLRNERMGFNRFYSGYEDSKYQLPTSGDLYNRTYGI